MIHGIEQNNIHFKPGYIFFSMTFQDASLDASIKSSFLTILSVISRLASMLGPSLEIEAWRFQASVEAILSISKFVVHCVLSGGKRRALCLAAHRSNLIFG